MRNLPTLVFGDDGSPAADVAWLFVNNHRWTGWRVDVVAVQPPSSLDPLPPDLARLHPWKPDEPRLAFAEAGFEDVAHLTAIADPRLILSRQCDLLMIGPRGPGLLKALHLGSTADWLLLHPPAPMMIVRHGHPLRTVLVCADGSPHAARAVAALRSLPFASHLGITVLAVDDGRIDADEAVLAARVALGPFGSAAASEIAVGWPTSQIKLALDRLRPDLVVLGTRGLTGLRHLRLGSTASATARTAECSVLIACDEHTEDPGAQER